MSVATLFALSYSIINKNNVLIINYGIICLLDVVSLLWVGFRFYYPNSLPVKSDDMNRELLLFIENKSNDVDDIISILSQ